MPQTGATAATGNGLYVAPTSVAYADLTNAASLILADLTKDRARHALVGGNSISATRLMPVGVGSAAPVADNRTDEGRAKNRRVELVELP